MLAATILLRRAGKRSVAAPWVCDGSLEQHCLCGGLHKEKQERTVEQLQDNTAAVPTSAAIQSEGDRYYAASQSRNKLA
jgi:hypothetical protein